jgi:hypothetical protein
MCNEADQSMKNLSYELFKDIDLSNKFFDSLRQEYSEFSVWFRKKAEAGEKAYLFHQQGIKGFLYIKLEEGVVDDVVPPIPNGKHIKIGTLKLHAHGTRLGQRFVKKIFDRALASNADDVYVNHHLQYHRRTNSI